MSTIRNDKRRRWLGGLSLGLGILAAIGFFTLPPDAGCFGNPQGDAAAVVAVLAVIFGMAGLFTTRDAQGYVALAGLLIGVASPFVPRPFWRSNTVARNESATLGDIRTVMSAEAAYQSENSGFYDTLDCLNRPAACMPDYEENAPIFLDSTLPSLKPKSGYNRLFSPTEAIRGGRSPSSFRGYAYVTVPIRPGQTGQRAFCGDGSGMICSTSDGGTPRVEAGRCVTGKARWYSRGPAPCEPLR